MNSLGPEWLSALYTILTHAHFCDRSMSYLKIEIENSYSPIEKEKSSLTFCEIVMGAACIAIMLLGKA